MLRRHRHIDPASLRIVTVGTPRASVRTGVVCYRCRVPSLVNARLFDSILVRRFCTTLATFTLDSRSSLFTIRCLPEFLFFLSLKVFSKFARFTAPLSHADHCHRREFEVIVDGLSDALDFSQTIGVDAGAALPY